MTLRPTAEDANPGPVSEAPGTIGLLLNIGAVVAFALSLAAFGLGQSVVAGSMMSAALLSFVASLVCFAADGSHLDHRPVESRRCLPISGVLMASACSAAGDRAEWETAGAAKVFENPLDPLQQLDQNTLPRCASGAV
jgi:hypothetical protein